MFINTLDRLLSPMWRHTRVVFFYAEVKMSYKNDARFHVVYIYVYFFENLVYTSFSYTFIHWGV